MRKAAGCPAGYKNRCFKHTFKTKQRQAQSGPAMTDITVTAVDTKGGGGKIKTDQSLGAEKGLQPAKHCINSQPLYR